MTLTLLRRAFWAPLLCLAFLATGCDSDDTDDPIGPDPQGTYCEENLAAFGCTDSGVRIDTIDVATQDRYPSLPAATAQAIVVRDLGGGVGGADGDTPQTEITWSSEYEYILNGFVFVNEGQTLEIEPGTVIRGLPGSGPASSALIVARGGRIEANGQSDAPIIMTALTDDLSTAEDLVDGDNNPLVGQWGGLIVLGSATTNIAAGETNVEGIPTTETRGLYGGSVADDDSGIIRYVSIRHGGTLIGEGNEINGLTLGAVGSGTTIEYVEVFANQDDGVEWFGGTVNARYLAVSYCGDDMYDYDLGYNGFNQYVFGLMDDDTGDNGGEHDGGVSDLGGGAGEAAEPFAIPTFANVTYIGRGLDAARVMTIRDNAGANYWRAIFQDFADGVRIEDKGDGSSGERAREGDINFIDALFWNVVSESPEVSDLFTYYEDSEGAVPEDLLAGPIYTDVNPGLSVDQAIGGSIDLTPASAIAPQGPALPAPLDNTSYIGAFESNNWLQGWTAISQYSTLN